MAGSSEANSVPEGTTLVFGSYACMADGSGSFSGHLITPKAPEAKLDNHPTKEDDAAEFGGNQVPPELNSGNLGNMSTPTRADELAESDTNPNFENF